MPWNSLGTVTPAHGSFSYFSQSASLAEFFRLTYAASTFTKVDSFGWLAWRYIGGEETLPPVLAMRVYPDMRGRLIHLPYPPQMIDLGYVTRQFEIRKNWKDAIFWSIQIEELII
ncbi:hypothetical protein NIES2119_09940 [[Phormidium ambiguum] IAM M-71]|uniref:Uncharacterized protein n=1 Tax=[Phormidium ambiguum] IAM M-71 TaxID=454136 RepID=A0A1U7IMA5_9CYAN|nr:hypothetical protein [Phormidium ambiguum]OKH38348.1 hypothetical protein NIES2119_09940 [Phormidium ambiguum IAM M-71]